jgi:hypothetical protein
MKELLNASLLVSGEPGRLGTLIYKVVVEILRTIEARHIHLRN